MCTGEPTEGHGAEEQGIALPERLCGSEALHLFVDAVQDYALFGLSDQGCITHWNAGAQRLLGYAADEVLGRHCACLFLPEAADAGQPAEELEQALAQGRYEDSGWRVRQDGSPFWARSLTAALRDETGRHVGYCQVLRDCGTQRQRELMMTSVFDHALDGIICIDHHGVIQSFNPAAEAIFGYTEAEVRGRNVNVLMPEPDRSLHDSYLANYLRTGEAKIIGIGRQVTGLRQDGSIFPLDLGVSTFQFDGLRYFTGMVRDLTQQQQLEDQLRQAQKMEAIGQLASGVAHDFNNLLTVIIGYAQMLMAQAEPDSEEREMLSTIKQSGDRAALLTQQLLAFSRKQVMQPRLLNLNQIVKETEKMLRRLIGEDISMVTALDPELNPVQIDPGQFMQVLMNLAVNARDAMPQGGKLTIKTSNFIADAERVALMPEYREGPYVLLSMSDDGCGMPPEVKARVFEPFFTTKPQGKGTGLGLSTVYGIIKQSGGNIEVYSEADFGTTFKIYLPALAGETLGANGQEAAPVRGSETVLLVEDEGPVRLVAMLILEAQGYFVLEAADGADALRRAEEHAGRIDLLLTDVVMPGMNGSELADLLQERLGRLRVLFMSGYTDDAVFRHGLLHKDVPFLQKPFTPTTLTHKVREVLDG
jgi:PAS domain S-box-containing protein